MTDEEIAVALAEQGKEIGSLKHRMDNVEKIVDVVHQLAQEMVGLSKEIKHMNKNLEQLNGEVAELKAKPANRWEQIVSTLIGAGLGALIASIL